MENQIVCPKCKKTLPGNQIISDAAKGEGSFTRHILCDCGEKITYWQITAQFRDQKRMAWRFRNWVQSFSRTRV